MSLLTVSGLTTFYGPTFIFGDVSFRVARGDKLGLVGVNGAGKSTLLRIIAATEEFIRRYKNGSRRDQAVGRERRLTKLKEGYLGVCGIFVMPRIEAPKQHRTLGIRLDAPARSGEVTLRIELRTSVYQPRRLQTRHLRLRYTPVARRIHALWLRNRPERGAALLKRAGRATPKPSRRSTNSAWASACLLPYTARQAPGYGAGAASSHTAHHASDISRAICSASAMACSIDIARPCAQAAANVAPWSWARAAATERS